jgi:hypothetical protein
VLAAAGSSKRTKAYQPINADWCAHQSLRKDHSLQISAIAYGPRTRNVRNLALHGALDFKELPMPTTATYKPTGNIYTDSVLSGVKWAASQLTFSFPANASYYGSRYGNGEPSNNFEAFTPAQQSATRAVLQHYSSVINVKFIEVTETSKQHGDLRYAETDAVKTAWAYYPSTSATGGDAWFNNSSNWYDNPTKGNYGYFTIMHETGHAMGLKHTHEARGSFPTMPSDRDSIEYSVMSYKSYVGSTKGYYTNEQWSYPQSLMMYDIAALQNLYGANYTTNAGNSVYKWNPQTGEMSINGAAQGAPGGNRVFLTIWDGGGNDTYDFSNYTSDLNVNLQPGLWTTISQTQLANLGDGRYAAGNIANALLYKDNPASLIENVIGGSGNDKLVGNGGNNSFTGNAGNDTVDGLSGVNTAIFSGSASDYSLKQNSDGSWTVTDLRAGSPDGTDQLKNIQYFKFQDTTIGSNPNAAPVNSSPDAINDSYSTARNTKLVISPSSGVLANDVDTDGNLLTATLVSGPKNGTVSLKADGSFSYTPNRKFTGTDSFTYKASDGSSSDAATVTLNVGTSSATSSNGRGSKGLGANVVLSDHNDTIPTPISDSFAGSQNSLQEKLQGLLDSFGKSFHGEFSDFGPIEHLAGQKFKIDVHDVFDHMLVR